METKSKLEKSYAVKPNGELKQSIKDVDMKSRIVTGMYCSMNVFDSTADVLLPGCCNKSIKENGVGSEATAKIKHALFHDLNQLPGKIQVLEERTIDGLTGVYFETKMVDTTIGNDTLINYQEKIYDNHSIGFQYVKLDLIQKEAHGNSKQWDNIISNLVNPADAEALGFLYAVSEIKLYEGSTVAFGANSLTPFLGVKSNNPDALKLAYFKKIDQLKNALKRGTQTDDMLYSFELQLKQFKQMVVDMCQLIPEKKIEAKTICKSCEKEFDNLKEAGMGYAYCPNCGNTINTAAPKQAPFLSDSLIKNFTL